VDFASFCAWMEGCLGYFDVGEGCWGYHGATGGDRWLQVVMASAD